MKPLLLALVAPLLLTFVPRPARAADAPTAQALFDEGKALANHGLYADACPKFAESQRLDPGLGTEFHLADCWQHMGRNASAWAAFRDVESQAHARGERARERVAHDRAEALAPFVSKLVVVPRSAADEPGLEVERDGATVDAAGWNTPVPVDPGSHVVAAGAPNKVSWQTVVEVPANGKIVTVEIPPLADASPVEAPSRTPAPTLAPTPAPLPAASSSALPLGATSVMPPSAPEAPIVDNRGGFQRASGWFFIGAGAVGLAAGGYFGARWLDDWTKSNARCPNDRCDAYGANLRSDATSQAHTAEIAAGAGGASLLVGVLLVATAPSPRVVFKPVAGVEITPTIAAAPGGLVVHGTW